MRIAYLSRRQIPSKKANSVQIVKMCEAFAQLGHAVTLYALPGDAPPAAIFARYGVAKRFGVSILPANGTWFRKVRFLTELIGALRSKPLPDLFFGRDVASLAAVARFGRPLIYEAHILPKRQFLQRLLLRWLFSRDNFSHLVCTTSTLADAYRRDFAALAHTPIVVAPNAAADPAPTEGQEWPAIPDWTGRAKALQVGFVGRPFPGKGIEAMLHAARKLPGIDFHIVGAERDDLSWVEGRMPANLHFHGYQHNCAVAAYLSRFDIAAAPYGERVMNASGVESASVTSPLKLLEYLAAGLPTIVSDLPGVADILDHGEGALLVAPGDFDGFVAAIGRLAADPDLRADLGDKARRIFLEKHTANGRAKQVLSCLRDPQPHSSVQGPQ